MIHALRVLCATPAERASTSNYYPTTLWCCFCRESVEQRNWRFSLSLHFGSLPRSVSHLSPFSSHSLQLPRPIPSHQLKRQPKQFPAAWKLELFKVCVLHRYVPSYVSCKAKNFRKIASRTEAREMPPKILFDVLCSHQRRLNFNLNLSIKF